MAMHTLRKRLVLALAALIGSSAFITLGASSASAGFWAGH